MAVVLTVSAGLAGAPAVVADPGADIAAVQAQIEDLQTQAEMAAEQLNGARVRLARIQDKQTASKAKAAKARESLVAQARELGVLASVAYRSGGLDATVQLLLADNPADFLQQSAALDIVARGQNAMLRRTASSRLSLAQANATLAQQEAEAAAVEQEIAQQKSAIEANLAEQERVLSQLQEEQRRQLEAQRKAEAEAAAQRAEAARAAAAEAAQAAQDRENAAANNNDTTGGGSSGGGSSGDGGGGGGGGGQNGGFVGSDQAAIAVAAALAQVGEPYTYDAQPPDTWDCSKLTAWAWAQAGVSLTAYSYDQANEVRRISTDELRPGDLLFYFNNAHHVSMYIGNGQIVEAASPSRGVVVSDAWNSWGNSHFSFAGRPVG